MKTKLFIAMLVCTIVSTVYAVTTITYNVPDAFGKELLAAIIAQSDTNVHIQFRGSSEEGGDSDYRASVSFRTPVYDPNIPAATNVKRRVAQFAAAMKVAHEMALAREADEAYIAAKPVIDVNDVDPNDFIGP